MTMLPPEVREADIVRKPPRVLPLHPDQFDDDAFAVLAALRGAIASPPTTEMPEFNATMLRHPELYRVHSALALKLFKGALAPRDRELAILRTGWLCQAPFQWGTHVKVAKRVAGLSEEEIERVTQGSAAPGWSQHDRAILRAVEELHGNAMISDETWAVLALSLDEAQLLELPILVGQYQGVAYLQNSLRIRLAEDNKGLSAR